LRFQFILLNKIGELLAESIKRESLSDRVFHYLKAQLANRQRRVGDRLNTRELATELSVSRTTTNKAIERLIEEGFVKLNDLRQPVVTAVPAKLKIHQESAFEFSNQTDSTYELLLEKILKGEIAPGELIKERPLAMSLGVNPATLRRAAEWLRGDGLLERLPRRGWRVSMLTPRDMKDAYQIRMLLEPRAVSEAVRWISEEELDQIEEDTSRLIELGEKATVFDRRDGDFQFHQKLCAASGNRILTETLEPLIGKLLLITTVGFRFGRSSKSFEEHREVLKAIRQRDEKKAVRTMKSHLRNAARFNEEIWDRH